MATLGIVGGMGPESTIEYYRAIIRAYQERHGANTAPSIVIHSVDAHAVLGLFGAGKIPEAIEFLVAALRACRWSTRRRCTRARQSIACGPSVHR